MLIDQSLVAQYELEKSNVFIEALQEKVSVLKDFATIKVRCAAEYYRVPLHDTTDVEPRTQRIEEITATELNYATRGMRPALFKKFLQLSTDDPLFLDHLPANLTMHAKELGYAAERQIDKTLLGTMIDFTDGSETKGQSIIMDETGYYGTNDSGEWSPYNGVALGGILGKNYIGRLGTDTVELPQGPVIGTSEDPVTDYYSAYTGESTTPVNTTLTNVIPVNYARTGDAAASGLTIEKLLKVKQCYADRYVADNDLLCMAVTPQQVFDLLNEERLQNRDYGYMQLKTGFVDHLFGIRFLVTKNVPLVNIGSGYVRACPVWRPQDIMFGTWDDAKIHIRQPQNMIDQVLVGCTFGIGAARTREETVISVHCDEGRLS
ncbi:MAG: phage capsid protein [Akkermansiaceae bacterium]|nr:phage capsid protein [Akkermansiaceae bacterium]